jgi:hypothetical protein
VSRTEIVLLVSRTFAAIQFVTALIEMSYLPLRLFSYYHYVANTWTQHSYGGTYDQIDILSLFARIAGLLILTAVFWKCGPWIERVVFSREEAS